MAKKWKENMNNLNNYQNTPFDLKGKVAFVTGAAGFLGKQFAVALASAGAKVILADTVKTKLEKITDEPDFKDVETMTIEINITDRSSVSNAVKLIEEKFEGIDILVNSAAIDAKFDADLDTTKFTKFTNFPLSMWKDSLSVNLDGAFILAQEVLKVMEKKNKGSVIFIGSNYGLVGPDQRIYKKKGENEQSFKPPVYSVAKAGLIGLTKFLAAYYAGTEIRVNMLTPSGVYNNHDDEFKNNYASNTILRRMSEKEEFRGGVIFLASEASSYMTGGNLVIDGGWTAL